MADKLSVNVDALRTSATSVRGSGDDLDTSHTTTHSAVTSAASGWKGQSAEALTAFTARMKESSAAAVTRIDSHSQHMHGAATKFADNETQRAGEMADLDRAAQAERSV